MEIFSNKLKFTYLVYASIIFIWILAWTLKSYVIDINIPWLATTAGSFVYWTIAKVLIWILPAFWLIKMSGRSISQVLNFKNWKKSLIWGIGVGLIFVLLNFIGKFLGGHSLFRYELSSALFNAAFIAPIFEEFLMRGSILYNLSQEYSFWKANIITSFMFLGLHMPGWYFTGNFMQKFSSITGGAVFILIIGFALGFVSSRAKSLLGSIVVHFMNNISSI